MEVAMDLRSIINAIEDLFYDIVAWIALYPKTVAKVLLRPGWVQQYVSAEWLKPREERFRNHVNPAVFWFISMILFTWGLSSEGMGFELEAFVLYLVLFAMLPAIFASVTLVAQRISLSMDDLRRPMYIQMLIFGAGQTLLAFLLAILDPLVRGSLGNPITDDLINALFVLVVGLTWFLLVFGIFLWIPVAETLVFLRELRRPFFKTIGWVLLGLFLGGLLLLSMPLLAGELDIVASMVNIPR